MIHRAIAKLNADKTKRAIILTGAFLVFLGLLLYFFRAMGQNLSGEAFYDFQYPYSYPLASSWRVFFLDRIRSRLMHGVFISGLYHAFGYNPAVFYLVIYLIVVATAVVLALVIAEFIRQPWLAVLVTIAFALLPLNIPDLFQLKKAHHVLAWFLFWLAAWLIKKWVVRGKRTWLLTGTFCFLLSVLAYEATIALLPVALLVSLPHFNDFKEFTRKAGVLAFSTVCVALAFLRLEDLKPFSGIGQVYPQYTDLAVTASRLFSAGPKLVQVFVNGTLLTPYASPRTPFAIFGLLALLSAVCFAAYVFWVSMQSRKGDLFARIQTASTALIICTVYLSLATYLPFMLAGQAPDGDSLRGASFGVVMLAVALTALRRPKKIVRRLNLYASSLSAVLCLVFILLGVLNYVAALERSRSDDHRLNNFIYTLKEQIPGVRENTIFIFVNAQFSRTGCLGMMNMLYSKKNLHCIHLLDGDQEEQYLRTSEGLQEVGGRLFPEDFITLTFDSEGVVRVLDSIGPEDYPLVPVTWESTEPVRSNQQSILYEPEAYGEDPTKDERALIKMLKMQQSSAFYEFILRERDEMGW